MICTIATKRLRAAHDKYLSEVMGGLTPEPLDTVGADVAQLVSARPSEEEVPGSILGDFNVCFDFPLIRVAIALNTRKTEH